MFIRLWSLLAIGLISAGIWGCAPAEYAMPLETAPDTIRVAVLPIKMGGLDVSGSDDIWGSGIRGLLLSLMYKNPRIKAIDRGNSTYPASENERGGAPFVIMGSYLMRDTNTFESLELRMMQVDTGKLIARTHLNGRTARVEDSGDLLVSFLTDALGRAGTVPVTISGQGLPCNQTGYRTVASALHHLDMAGDATNPEAAKHLLVSAAEDFEHSKAHFCREFPSWLERLTTETESRLDLARNPMKRIE